MAEKAPVEEIQMNDININKVVENSSKKSSNFIIFISDFYYLDSASKLKTHLIKESKIENISIKKINDNKYRLSVGPFKNFSSLKSTYISLNNLGFDELDIHRE